MRDLSTITSPAELSQAIAETEEAIHRGEEDIRQIRPTANPEMVQALLQELQGLQQLKRDKGW